MSISSPGVVTAAVILDVKSAAHDIQFAGSAHPVTRLKIVVAPPMARVTAPTTSTGPPFLRVSNRIIPHADNQTQRALHLLQQHCSCSSCFSCCYAFTSLPLSLHHILLVHLPSTPGSSGHIILRSVQTILACRYHILESAIHIVAIMYKHTILACLLPHTNA